MNDSQIQEWRQQGPRQKRVMLIITLVVFALGILAMVLLSIRTAFPAPAPQMSEQGTPHRGMMRQGADQQLAWLTKKLNLTDEQKAKIKPIFENEHTQLAALRKDSSLSRQEKRAAFMKIRSKTFSLIHPILTEEQQATLQQMQQKREQRMKAWRERRSGSQAPESQ